MPLHRILLPEDARLEARFDGDLLGGVSVVTGDAVAVTDADWEGTLYRMEPPKTKPFKITAIPYYAWDHREPGEMRVWIRAS